MLQNLVELDRQEQTILIIDDDPANLGIITDYLRELDFKILVARNGESGLERAIYGQPDLILLDILMPGIDGFETCRRLKLNEATQDIPVIFMTSLIETEHKVRGLQLGAVDYITKPIQEEEVLARVLTHLRLRELNERLEQKVRERTNELTTVNQQLEREIIERKQAEEELRKHREHLEELVAERTAELNERMAEVEQLNQTLANLLEDQQATNRDLEETARKLQDANKELEAFAYTVSHDLRAPLRAIDGFSSILLEEYAPDLSAEAAHYLQRVVDNTQQMAQLIDDLLTFSRLGRHPLQKKLIAPADIVHQVLQGLRHEQEGRQVDISVGDLPPCQVDPTLFKQVFVNLLSNALKFTRGRKVARIEVGCISPSHPSQAEKKEDGGCTYFVKDNGVGFDMRYSDKLFGVFQRLHHTDEYEGTGVGLAIAQRIIHRHGGRVWAEAEEDKGATFYFTPGEEGTST